MRVIGFAGKGGTGKTTLAALFLKGLMEDNAVLVIDSDPNECLPGVLGAREFLRLSDVVARYEGKTIDPDKFAQEFGSMLLMNEQNGYDLLVMGRGESEGCYCIINHMLKNSFERNILKGAPVYDYIIMDCEAGIEHISRKTSSSIHDLIVVTDASRMGLDTLTRIKVVSRAVKSDVRRYHVVANRITDPAMAKPVEQRALQLGMGYLGFIPRDPLIEDYNFLGRPLLELPGDSKAYVAVRSMMDRVSAAPESPAVV